MKLAEILSGPETWYQGGPGECRSDYNGVFGCYDRVCLWKALKILHGEEVKAWEPEFQRLMRIIGDLPMTWNDAPGRTWEEVAAVVEAYDRDRLLNP